MIGWPRVLCLALLMLSVTSKAMAEQSIRVFVGLCDNKTQGIVPVGKSIGDGDKPDENLYWGCADGFGAYFKKSPHWEVIDSTEDVSGSVLRRLRLRHKHDDVTILAEAYRGSRLRECVQAFERVAASGEHELVAFIGHNGLMDFSIPVPEESARGKTDVAVLCCKSRAYFLPRMSDLGCRPILMTEQFMYPGAFILHDVIEVWRKGATPGDIRKAAGRAYAANQGISVSAATGVFSDLSQTSTASGE